MYTYEHYYLYNLIDITALNVNLYHGKGVPDKVSQSVATVFCRRGR